MKNKKFEEYFLQYKNLVMRVVMDKTSDYQVAQEICQQVFVSLYTNMDKITPELVKAWLMRCTQHAVYDYTRRKRLQNEIFTEVEFTEIGNLLVEKSVELHEEKLEAQELTGRILKEVRAVNVKWFNALVAVCVDGMSYPEAARKLNVPAPVLRARVYRARVFIKEKFGDEYERLE